MAKGGGGVPCGASRSAMTADLRLRRTTSGPLSLGLPEMVRIAHFRPVCLTYSCLRIAGWTGYAFSFKMGQCFFLVYVTSFDPYDHRF